MSYGFNMYFKKVNSKTEAFEFGMQVMDSFKKNAREYFYNKAISIPTLRNSKETNTTDKYWLHMMLTKSFTYWEEYNLVGMFAERIPKETIHLFDTCIYFQNSSDANYAYDKWKGIPYFENVISDVQGMNKEEIVDIVKKNYGYEEKEEIDELRTWVDKDLDFYQKVAVYSVIFATLDLDTWMSDNLTSEKYIRFNLCSINGGDELFQLKMLLREVKEQFKKEIGEE